MFVWVIISVYVYVYEYGRWLRVLASGPILAHWTNGGLEAGPNLLEALMFTGIVSPIL